MQVFFGIYSALFFTIIFGMIWPHKTQHELWQAFIGYFAKSLWLSWGLVLISFYTSLGTYLPELICILTLIILLRYFIYSGPDCIVSLALPAKSLLYLFVFLFSVFVILVLFKYSLIFDSWDAVVSWNRWAIELSGNTYQPLGAAYPILFPGIWSLVYEAQGTSEIWITAKLTMLMLPFIILMMMYFMFAQGRYLSGAIFSATAGFLLLRFFKKLTSGWMDFPVAALLLIGLTLLFYVVENNQKLDSKRKEIFLFAAVILGLAAITKQAGVFGLLPVIYLSVIYYFRKEITLFEGGVFIFVSILPAILFYILYKMNGTDLTGNLEHLRGLVNINVKYINKYITSMMKILGLAPWILLFIPAIFINFKHKKSLVSTQLAFLCLAISIVGYFIYTDCCSYHNRNGAWIPIILTVVAMLGIIKQEAKILDKTKQKIIHLTSNRFVFCMIGCGVFLAGVSQLVFSSDDFMAIQIKYQKRMGIVELSEMIYNNKNHLEARGVVISGYQYIAWLPGFSPAQYHNCTSDECVFKAIKKKPGSLVLVERFSEFYAYPKFFESAVRGRLLDKVGNYELYKAK